MNHSVKLVAMTQPTDDPNDTVEGLIAYCARVSNPANQNNAVTASKLLGYLIKNNHWSPFEMVHMVLEIQCTRTIGRQILRHRSFSFQEFSQRYAEVTDDMFIKEPLEARLQDHKNRQNSISTDNNETIEWWDDIQKKNMQQAKLDYLEALALGVAKEQARAVLPEGLTMSRMYMSGSLRSWIHYCQLRMGNGTQKEHQDIARDCWQIILKEFPSLQGIFNSLDINVLQHSVYSNATNTVVSQDKDAINNYS